MKITAAVAQMDPKLGKFNRKPGRHPGYAPRGCGQRARNSSFSRNVRPPVMDSPTWKAHTLLPKLFPDRVPAPVSAFCRDNKLPEGGPYVVWVSWNEAAASDRL